MRLILLEIFRKYIWPGGVFTTVVLASVGAYIMIQSVHTLYRTLLPDVTVLKTHYPVAIGKENNRNIYKLQSKKPIGWRTLRDVPRKVTAAILTAEDGNFFQHKGFDPEAIREAWKYNLKPGNKVIRGGSTITQQVVKNLFLSPEKTISRKIRELLLAVELERNFSKAKILEIYLNIAEWGPGVYGIERASQRHFKKPASQLTVRDGAVLAFMLPNPKRYQYSYRNGELSGFGAHRVETILEKMWKSGHLSNDEYLEERL